MTAFLFLVAFVFGIVVGYFVMVSKSKKTFLANAEYWVFYPGEEMPSQDAVMTRMMSENPYAVRGRSPVTNLEGLVFSDVRLHIALVKRSKNAHAFRPDLFADADLTSIAALDALTNANSFVKLRYTSDDPLPDKRHLRFLVHAADAYAELGGSSLIYDVVGERIITREVWQTEVAADPDATGSNFHVRVRWNPTQEGHTAETRGMAKVGLDELVAPSVQADERLLAGQVLVEAISTIWAESKTPESLVVPGDHDSFRLAFRPLGNRKTEARILRLQAL